MVIVDDGIFNKPADRTEARRMLRHLSGRTHTVVTALALLRVGGEALVDAVYADVTFNELTDELIEAYVESGEADDKAGAYGIQGRGAQFIGVVDGDLTCVIGLPMGRLREMHQEMTSLDLFAGKNLREVAMNAFPDLKSLPEACLAGIF
jgi:septum formation protein